MPSGNCSGWFHSLHCRPGFWCPRGSTVSVVPFRCPLTEQLSEFLRYLLLGMVATCGEWNFRRAFAVCEMSDSSLLQDRFLLYPFSLRTKSGAAVPKARRSELFFVSLLGSFTSSLQSARRSTYYGRGLSVPGSAEQPEDPFIFITLDWLGVFSSLEFLHPAHILGGPSA